MANSSQTTMSDTNAAPEFYVSVHTCRHCYTPYGQGGAGPAALQGAPGGWVVGGCDMENY